MEECYPNIKTRMRMVMSKWGENWRTQKVQKDTVKYMYYCIPIKDDTLCEMTERKFVSTDESTFLLINYDAFSCASETIITKRNQDEVELNVRNADIKNISKGKSMDIQLCHIICRFRKPGVLLVLLKVFLIR